MAGFAEEHRRKRIEVEQEIENHGKTWCSPDCTSLLEREYRRQRLISGLPAEQVQEDFDCCHISQISPS